jgi:hypothetical protein
MSTPYRAVASAVNRASCVRSACVESGTQMGAGSGRDIAGSAGAAPSAESIDIHNIRLFHTKIDSTSNTQIL